MASKRMALGAKRGRVAALLLAPIAVAVLFTAIATAAGDAPGSFSATGSMTKTRFGAAAARLPNGRVLIAGGTGADERQSAEIFKQRTGSFKRTGSMTVRRFVPAAAPLPNGRVLVAGGFDNLNGYLKSAEIFNPQTATFAPTGSMTKKRFGAAAAPLTNGRVLITGGVDGAGRLKSAEIFNPRTGSFRRTGSMTVKRFGAAAAPLADGRVLVAGGSNGASFALRSAELFSPCKKGFKLKKVKGKKKCVKKKRR